MDPVILANVIRGETVESIHRGHFIVLDGDGRTIASAGDASAVTTVDLATPPGELRLTLAPATIAGGSVWFYRG